MPNDRKRIVIVSVSVLALMVLIGLLSKLFMGQNNNSKSGFYFDTVINITLYDNGAEEAIDECFKLAEKYEKLFSKTITGSDIYRINNSRGNSVKVNQETFDLIKTGIYYSKMSDGLFDITCGKLSTMWDTDSLTSNIGVLTLPTDTQIEKALANTDYKLLELDEKELTVTLHSVESAVDLGAIAKGYVADRMKEYLNSKGFSQGIINLGGNVLTIGPKTSKENYKIGIQKPFSREGELATTISVKDKSVVTSGTYQRYVRDGEYIYHHIIDLHTGYPVDNSLDSVTIISDSSTEGDALSTIVFCMGYEKGFEYIKSLDNIEAVFITKDGNIYDTRD